jgi:hypothetical protein
MDDYHLLPGSPLIEAGNPASPAAGALDLDGGTRAVDGNGDCIIRRDVGADEFVTAPPNCSSPAAAPLPLAPGSTTTRRCPKGKKLKRVKGKRKCVRKKRKK